ncbi:MAG: FecR domain-containing protein [Gammaproteobacteria bacterium]|nr:FecR domain-containing protein [Gammaproteobacteria bacterium]
MNEDDIDSTAREEDSLAELFANVTPRSKPAAAAEERAFTILEAQWRDVANRRKRRNRLVSWGIAASLVLSMGIAFKWLGDTPTIVLAPVADIARVTGSAIYANNQHIDGGSADFPRLSVGETLATGPDSRVALSWSTGGSLRIDENSEIRFVSTSEIQLVSGTVYFDSLPYDRKTDAPNSFSIDTVAGRISHVGTQFLTGVAESIVTVGVREGLVQIDSPTFISRVPSRNRIRITADGRQSKQLLEPFDESWRWAEEIAPPFDPQGRTVEELVMWISRETGRSFRFRSKDAAMNAASTSLVGLNNLSPLQALNTMQYATDLRYDIIDEKIVISLGGEQR